jgi:hypothetical protein
LSYTVSIQHTVSVTQLQSARVNRRKFYCYLLYKTIEWRKLYVRYLLYKTIQWQKLCVRYLLYKTIEWRKLCVRYLLYKTIEWRYINFYRGSNVKLCRNHLGFLINTNYMRNIPVKFDWFQKRIIYQLFFPWHLTSWSFCLCNIFKLSYTVSIQHTVSVTQLLC